MSASAVPQGAKSAIQTFGKERLSPGAYTLDLSQVSQCRVELNEERLTFLEALRRLLQEKAAVLSPLSAFRQKPEFKTEQNTYILKIQEVEGEPRYSMRESGLGNVFRTLVDLNAKGVNVDGAMWFYFDFDLSRDAGVSHSFFVVYDGKIVDEQCHFADWEPLILKKHEEKEPIWHSHSYKDEAWEIYCYRKFYSEMLTGQITVLRPDEPILYHFERPLQSQMQQSLIRATQVVTIRKIYHLLWVIAPLLVAIAFPSISLYMAIVAGLMLFNLLVFLWNARKVGKQL